jgi:hypothetical protein
VLFVRKRNAEQAIWRWVLLPEQRSAPPSLHELARGDRQVVIGTQEARRVKSYLEAEGFADANPPGNTQMPVEFVDGDGRVVDV